MCEIDRLRRRIEQIEAELEGVLGQTEQLRCSHRHRIAGQVALTTLGILLVGAYLTLGTAATTGSSNTVRGDFEVDDSSNNRIFKVSADKHSFVVYTESDVPSIIATASVGNTSLLVSPTGGASIRLGADGSTPVGASAPKKRTGGTGRGGSKKRKSGKGGSTDQGGVGSGVAVPSLSFNAAGLDGAYRILMNVVGGKPVFAMQNSPGAPIVYLLQGIAFPGGELGIFNAGGELAVRAGSSAAGIGRVEAFPLGNPIGSFIVGREK
jgi:hypothetical protein